MAEHVKKGWWYLFSRGLLAIALGTAILIFPDQVLYIFLILFGIVAILSGIFLIGEGFTVKDEKFTRGLRFIEGIFYILVGILTILIPSASLTVIMIFLGAWSLIVGIFQIITAVKLRKVIVNEWIGILNGLMMSIFAIFILADVFTGAQALMLVFGVFIVISGILSIILSFKIRNHKFTNIGGMNV